MRTLLLAPLEKRESLLCPALIHGALHTMTTVRAFRMLTLLRSLEASPTILGGPVITLVCPARKLISIKMHAIGTAPVNPVNALSIMVAETEARSAVNPRILPPPVCALTPAISVPTSEVASRNVVMNERAPRSSEMLLPHVSVVTAFRADATIGTPRLIHRPHGHAVLARCRVCLTHRRIHKTRDAAVTTPDGRDHEMIPDALARTHLLGPGPAATAI